jgi:hypothetical protein
MPVAGARCRWPVPDARRLYALAMIWADLADR